MSDLPFVIYRTSRFSYFVPFKNLTPSINCPLRDCSAKRPMEDESRALVAALHDAAVGCADPVLINSSFRGMISFA
jgi:hypothetical protein